MPASFAGWTATAPVRTGTALESADQANADVLKEYGLKDFAIGEYSRGNDRMTVRARRFADATGAYGAFTYYRHPGMHAADIGKGAAAGGNEVIFWTGSTLVDAIFERGTPDQTALKELAAAIPPAVGSEGIPPSLPRYLPAQGLDASSVRYAIGPAAYARTEGVLPPALVDFSRDAEAVTAHYTAHDGKGILTLLEYPTPQIAIERAKAIDTQLKQRAALESNSAALAVRRSGPLVAVTSGSFSSEEAQALLANVKYDAEVTVDHPEGYVSEVKKTARLLLGILYLTGILGGSSILVGLFLGGGRALIRRLRGKPISTLNDDDFITLKLGN
ncbi:MAG TPA: DUF6599 family protein [Silvibacterium sp.]|nr:DUF6599 family protein [Silvibacterium sp.]